MKNKKSDPLRSLKIGLGVFLVLVIYAYGFQVTQVRLEETKSERRQEQLFRILRALARPSLFEYEREVFEVRVPVMIPCPEEGFEAAPVADSTQPYMVVTPACSAPRTSVHVEGFNFESLTRGPLNLVPFESGVNLQLSNLEIDRFGHFETTVLLPNRPSENAHEIVAITRRNLGAPRLTQTAYDTWDKIIETVFLALLATTLGTIIAIPLRFFASRNLMKDVTISLLGISLSILLIPIGLYLGLQVADWSSRISQLLTGSIMLALPGTVVSPLVVKVIVGIGFAGLFNSLASRWGEGLSRRKDSLSRVAHIVLATAAGASLAIILMAIIYWFYQFRDINRYFAYAGGIGAIFGFLISLRYESTDAVPSGMIIYYVARTIFNALRSVEALVMAIVFVVWVGIGPFAGVMALGLHTIVSLAKLYSEQVESIMAGPLEAIQATGANRLQTIIYAVIPQIIPPYISYTMYRWDINVRMSTIIGFVGGGGIGFLLQQNINLLNYRAASAQMLAIAIVVSMMDYISSVLREKYV